MAIKGLKMAKKLQKKGQKMASKWHQESIKYGTKKKEKLRNKWLDFKTFGEIFSGITAAKFCARAFSQLKHEQEIQVKTS